MITLEIKIKYLFSTLLFDKIILVKKREKPININNHFNSFFQFIGLSWVNSG